MNPYKK